MCLRRKVVSYGLMRRHLFVLLEISCTKVRGIWVSEKSEYVFYIVT